jgi:hypothetical protein
MKYFRLAFVLAGLLALTLSSCQDLGEGLPGSGEWAIYRLSDPTLFSDQIRNVPLSQLRLAAEPFISVHDIGWYRWDTHSFECQAKVNARIDSLARYGGSVRGVPFVVTVGKDPIYLGSFWWSYSSIYPWCPTIDITFLGASGSNDPQLRIELPSLYQGEDPRQDRRIHESLRRAGVLLSG